MLRIFFKSISIIISIIISFPAISLAGERYFLLGVDVSGSYALKSYSTKMVENFILKEMKPGDTLVARRISEKSYLDSVDNMLLPGSFILPEIGEKPENRFNVNALKKYKKKQQHIVKLKIAAIKHLRSLKPVKAKMTDIYGFLASCSDRLVFTDKDTEKIIIIASDMQDNCNRRSDVNLAGAKVIIMAFETASDPVKTKKLRNQWIKWLLKMNAGKVFFLSPDQDINIVL